MLERTTRILSENLARAMDRRSFLKRAGATTFAGLAALAAGQSSLAFAAGPSSSRQPTINCAPPGPYCNTGGGDLSGCHGASCFQHMSGGQVYQCHVYYQYYQAGCWTTGGGNYWTCCDCQCTNGSTCGCAQQTGSPAPRPDGVLGGGNS